MMALHIPAKDARRRIEEIRALLNDMETAVDAEDRQGCIDLIALLFLRADDLLRVGGAALLRERSARKL